MTLLAGEVLTAGRAMLLQPATYGATATGPLASSSTTETDIPGASVTLTTLTDGAAYEVTAVFDCLVTTTNATTVMVGKLMVDGVVAPGTGTYGMDTADRTSVAAVWNGTLATAGSHTFKLRGNLNQAGGGGSFLQTNTKISIRITEVV